MYHLGKKKVPQDQAARYGCLAVEPLSREVLHYAEKPETFISDIINAGIYLFSPSVFALFEQVRSIVKRTSEDDPDYLRLEQDIFGNICGEKHVYLYETPEFWIQIKSAGVLVDCSANLLALQRKNPRNSLAPNSAKIIGDVLIHPTAKVDPSAKLGPNVTIGENVVVREGVRIAHSILLENVEVRAHACVLQSIIGKKLCYWKMGSY